MKQGSRNRGNHGEARQNRETTQCGGVPVRIGQLVDCEIEGLTHEGEGVGRVEGYALFVPGALPGERVRAEVESVGKAYGRARLFGVIKGSGERAQPPCPIYDACGGCQLQHLDYAAQLRWKRRFVVDNLVRIGKLKVAEDGEGHAGGVVVHPVIGMQHPWRYRNKAQVAIGAGRRGLVAGFHEQGSHDIVEMKACLIQHKENEELVRAVTEAANQLGISAYDRRTGRGLLRHVVVRHAASTGERMVVLVTNGYDIPHAQEWIHLIRERVPGVTSICHNVNTARTPVVFGEYTRTLWGEDAIYDEIGGIRFAISPRSFFQVNPVQTEVLYRKAVEYAGLTGEETVMDAYCGIGTITLLMAKHARKVYGEDIIPEAIEDARRNAEINGIRNAEFAAGAAEKVLPRWKAQGIRPDVIVVDPPRKGCDAALIATMLELQPRRIVYVSCNPSTLARDLRLLEDGGYRTAEVQPVDMFPHTGHVECCVSLVRREVNCQKRKNNVS